MVTNSPLHIQTWQHALSKAVPEPEVGISIALLGGDNTFSSYITQIPPFGQVKAHFHPTGIEIYHILSGQGEIHSGILNSSGEVLWAAPQEVATGSIFTIYPNIVHQLINKQNAPLVLIFTCDPSHLSTNRHLVKSRE